VHADDGSRFAVQYPPPAGRASFRSSRVGDAAFAVLEEQGFWGTVSFTDFFTLAQIDSTWRIVNKTFAHTGGEPREM
jgi:putative lumazine-binding protein